MSLLRFKSRETADVLMLAHHAKPILEAWGKDTQGPGVLMPTDMPRAKQAIESAVQAEEALQAQLKQEAEARGERAPDVDPIGLRQRSAPVLEMMRRCAGAKVEIVWGV